MRDELQKKFEIVDEFASADYIFDAYGVTLDKLFEACAAACFFAMTDPRTVEPRQQLSLEVCGDDINELLYNFISELVFLKDTQKMFFSEFIIKISDDRKSLQATIAGESINFDRHVVKTDVKAVTFHGLDIKKENHGFRTRMILDL
jgi:SHS2 domain-containing protein